MNLEILKKKSSNNIEVAVWAEKKQYYHIAISRYYYSEFQKIIYISKKLGFYKKPEVTNNSHGLTIQEFVESMKDKLTDEQKITILRMNRLKKLRNKADYDEIDFVQNDYNLSFKFYLNEIQEITNGFL